MTINDALFGNYPWVFEKDESIYFYKYNFLK